MPRQSQTSNVKKLCACGRSKWSVCAHPWYCDFKAPKDHTRRPNERYRKNLDLAAGRHAANLREAQDEARRAITAWLDGRDPADLQPSDQPTVAEVLAAYVKRPNVPANDVRQIKPLIRTSVLGKPIGAWRAGEVTRATLDAFRQQRPLVAGNRNLALLRAMFKWAVVDGLLTQSPFRVGDVPVEKLAREESRTRRLQTDEEARLLAACRPGTNHRGRPWRGNPLLHSLIVAALETGMRLGELLSLQWVQVRGDLFLPAGKTKARRARRVPISPALQAVLDARRNDPAGEPLPGEAFVFGDAVGRARGTIKTAWRLACRRAVIADLHFHDLRREAGSRWMDGGVSLATIQRWLGHANISQTSKYLAATIGADSDEMLAYQRRTGRLPQIDTNPGTNGQQPTGTDLAMVETAQQTSASVAIVHEPAMTIH